jgi:transposase
MTQNEKLALINTKTLIVGIDIAKRTHWVQPMRSNRTLLGKAFPIQNTRDGLETLRSNLEQIKQINQCDTIIIGLEPTGHYWKPLGAFLIQSGWTVVLVNPHHVKKSKELDDNTQTKSDSKDAGLIGRLVIDGRFFTTYLPTGVWRELRELTTTRNQIRRKLSTVLNHIRTVLEEYFPEYEKVFPTLTGKTSLHILREGLMPTELRQLEAEGILAVFRQVVRRGVGRKRAEALYQAAIDSIGTPADATIQLKLRLLMQEYQLLSVQKDQVETVMAERLQTTVISRYLLSIPGLGVVTVAGILGETGDLSRFTDWKQLRKLAGYNLVENSSGQHQGRRRISKRGRAGLRCHLYQAAVMMVSKSPEFRGLYQYLLSRPQNPLKKKQALVAMAMKLLRIIWALARKQEYYDPAKALGVYRQSQLAA